MSIKFGGCAHEPTAWAQTHGVPSSSCSAAGSLSSSWRSSSLSRVSSACLLATALSASFNALARDIRVPSRWLRFPAWRSAEGTLGGRVEDVRAASRTRARAGWDAYHEKIENVMSRSTEGQGLVKKTYLLGLRGLFRALSFARLTPCLSGRGRQLWSCSHPLGRQGP